MYAGFSGAAVPATDGGKKRHDHRQTVRQRDADAIAAADAGGRELFRHRLHLIAQRAVAEAEMVLRKNDRGLFGRTVFQQIEERGRCGRRGAHERLAGDRARQETVRDRMNVHVCW